MDHSLPSPRSVLTRADFCSLEDCEVVLHYYVNQPVREGIFRAKETFFFSTPIVGKVEVWAEADDATERTAR